MTSLLYFRSAILRILAVLVLLGASAGASAQMTYIIGNPVIERDFVLTGDSQSPARDGVAVRMTALMVTQGTEIAGYRFAWQLEKQEANGTWSVVPLAGGTNTARSASEVIGLSADPDIELPNAAAITHQGSLKPQNPLDPYASYRVVGQLERQPFLGSWGNVETPRYSSTRNLYHFTNTTSGDNARNVIATLRSVSVENPFLLSDASDSTMRGFTVRVQATARRWDDFNSSSVIGFVSFGYEVELRERDTGTIIPVSGPTSYSLQQVRNYDATGSVPVPSVTNFSESFQVTPLVQLDPVNKRYDLTVRITHLEPPLKNGNTQTAENLQLFHFNGAADFNGIGGVIDGFSRSPLPSANPQSSRVMITLQQMRGHLASSPDHTWEAPSSATVYLFSDGTASVQSLGASIPVTPSSTPDVGVVSNVRYTRQDLRLTTSGLRGTIDVILPQGFGYSTTSNRNLSGQIRFQNIALNNQISPTTGTLTHTFSGGTYVYEETKPAGIHADSLTWNLGTGEFEIGATGSAQYVRQNETQALAAAPVPDPHRMKANNAGYYASIGGVAGSARIRTAEDTSARLDAELWFDTGKFVTHFPYGSRIEHGVGHTIVENDRTSGNLEVFAPIHVYYDQSCPDSACSEGLHVGHLVLETTKLQITGDGGLAGSGPLSGNVQENLLRWGHIESLSDPGDPAFAHTIGAFGDGTFHATGHFISGNGGTMWDFYPEAASAKAANNGPGRIHLSAVLHDPKFPFDPHDIARPGSPADVAGTHHYAGINLSVESGMLAEAMIAGQLISYLPRDCGKFYARLSGVSGTVEAELGTFPRSLELYGYPFDFDYYGLAFLNSQTSPERSFTSGSLAVPFPADTKLPFEGLSFTCLGELDSARLREGGMQSHLSYWNADLDVFALNFVTSADCKPGANTFVTIGVQAFSTVLNEPLHGIIGIRPDGGLINQTFSIDQELETQITSRLRLPNNIELAGPADEVYKLTAVSEAYFNDYSSSSEQKRGEGRLHFAAKIDVPFFKDLKAHVRTTASRNYNVAGVVHLMGGWTENNNTFFNATFFDPLNRGFPAGVSEALYRNESGASGDPKPYLVRAQQEWLNVVPFDYPLAWSPSLRSFTAFEPETGIDLLIVQIDHQLEYLSAENAEISFGAVYEGMPRINLTNFVFNKIDEGTGVLQAMTDALRAEAVGALENGLNSLDNLLNDQINAILEEFLVTAVDPVIDSLYASLKTAAEDASDAVDSVNAWKNGVVNTTKEHLTGTVDQQADTLRHAIRQLSQAVGSTGSFIGTIDSSLEDVQLALRTVYSEIYRVQGGVSLDPPTVPNPSDTIQGLLTVKDGEYQIVQALINNLINEMADELGSEIAFVLNNMIEGPTEELNRLLNEQLEKVQPTLERVREVIAVLDGRIGQIREQLQDGREFISELEAILTAADAQIVAVTEEIRETVESFVIADIPSPDQFIEFSPEEVKQRIRQEISDRIPELRFLEEYQLAIRQRLYDVDLAIKEGIDTAFSQVNLVLKNLLSEYLTLFDDKINGFLGDLDAVLGAGELDGFAHIRGDALRLLRLDAYLQLQVPDELEFHGFLQIKQLDSDGTGSCSVSGTDVANEVTMGAIGVPVSWLSPGMSIDVEGKFSFVTGPFKLTGLGGRLEMVEGEFGFEAFTITDFGAAMSFGATENYIAAKAGLTFQSYSVAGAVFFGRTCSIAPLKMVNEHAASVLGEPNPTFSGAYVYGEAHIPVSEVLLGVPATCMFKITAGVGMGAFYFTEGPTYGGQMLLAVSGEALCLVSIKGEVSLVGAKVADDFRFSGRGRLEGRAGACPFCIKFGKSLQLEYRDDRWKYSL